MKMENEDGNEDEDANGNEDGDEDENEDEDGNANEDGDEDDNLNLPKSPVPNLGSSFGSSMYTSRLILA